MSKVCKPGADQSLIEYLALGESRSLGNLHKQQKLKHPKTSASTNRLKLWSSKFGWQDRAKEHDAQVTARASEKAIEAQASDRASVFESIQDALLDLLQTLRRQAGEVPVKSMDDLKNLSDVIVSLSAHGLDLQRGKQPDRDLIEALIKEKMLGNGMTSPSSGPPTAGELDTALQGAFTEPESTKH